LYVLHTNFFFLEHLHGYTNTRKFTMAKTNTFGKPDWFDIVEAEYEACRENVSLLDYSSFTKLDIQVSKYIYFYFKG
jgi:glycine cleavage system aminomethyltransferase T